MKQLTKVEIQAILKRLADEKNEREKAAKFTNNKNL